MQRPELFSIIPGGVPEIVQFYPYPFAHDHYDFEVTWKLNWILMGDRTFISSISCPSPQVFQFWIRRNILHIISYMTFRSSRRRS